MSEFLDKLPVLNWGFKRKFQLLISSLCEVRLQVSRFATYWFERVFACFFFPDLKITSGPFKGLQYPRYPFFQEIFSTFIPKLAGAYESELHAIIKKLKKVSFQTIINIGSDDGYYGVGFGMANPQARLLFFEPNRTANYFAKQVTQINSIAEKRCYFESRPTPAKLRKSISGKTLIISDCEGAELDYFSLRSVPDLVDATMLIEVHDAINPVISQSLKKRFAETHVVKTILAQPPGNYGRLYQKITMNEKRAALVFWLYCSPKRQ